MNALHQELLFLNAHLMVDVYEEPLDFPYAKYERWGVRCRMKQLDGAVQAVVARKGEITCVSIRGTQVKPRTIMSAVRNLAVRKVEGTDLAGRPMGRLHRGFYSAAKRVVDALELGPSGYLSIGGHSQGGAVALQVAQLLHPMYRVCRVDTFGAPRDGDRESAELFPKDIICTRWASRWDLVTRVPIIGYRHKGQREILHRHRWAIPRVRYWHWSETYRNVAVANFVDPFKLVGYSHAIEDEKAS